MNTNDWKDSEYKRLYLEVKEENRAAGSITFPSVQEFEELRAGMLNKKVDAAKQILRCYLYSHCLKHDQYMTIIATMAEFEELYSELKKGALSRNSS